MMMIFLRGKFKRFDFQGWICSKPSKMKALSVFISFILIRSITTIINGRVRSQKYTRKKKVLIAMTSEFKLPLEDCHENLGKNPSTK